MPDLRLDLDPEAEPIAGVVRDADGSSRPFRGWLELAAAIEAARTAPDFEGEPT